jgi:hypothetical protein
LQVPNPFFKRESARQINKPKCDPETPFGQLGAKHLLAFDVCAGRSSLSQVNVTPPANYVERNPLRGAWESPAEPPLPWAFTTELLLPNGKTTAGVWTGGNWWGEPGELKPVGWRWVDNAGLSYKPEPKIT